MITLIYGDDLEKIELDLITLVSNKKSERIDGLKVKLKDLEEKLLGGSLFGDETTFIIENLFKNKIKKDIFVFLESGNNSFNVILVERGRLTKRDLSVLKFDSVLNHNLPQYYFRFLDDFYPGSSKSLGDLYKELLKTMTAEQVYYSLVKRIRALIAVKANLSSHSEISRFAPWQLGKLKQQGRMWEEGQLVNFYKKLFEVEVKMKTSALPLPLEKYLDIMIRTELN